MGRSSFVVRREGRYVFRTRLPPCLLPHRVSFDQNSPADCRLSGSGAPGGEDRILGIAYEGGDDLEEALQELFLAFANWPTSRCGAKTNWLRGSHFSTRPA